MKRHLSVAAIAAIAGALAAGAVQSMFSAFADQSERVPPTSGIFTGVQYSQLVGDGMRSISSGNKGPSAPANVGGSAVDGLEWLDDSASLWLKKRYVNGDWAVEGAYNAADSTWIGIIGGGAPVSIASASTVDLGSVPQANVTITGTTGVTGFGAGAASGVVKIIRFDDALTLTHSSNLLVPGGFNLTTAANDRAIVTHLGSGAWEITQYTRASGVPIDVAAVGKAEMNFQASTPALYLPGDGRAIARASYPAYTAKMTRAQNGTRTSGNATITSVADTSRFGVGMPVESTGVNAGCTIASFVANTSITLNSSACVTSSGTSTVTVFLTGYGSGGSSSTIGVPDCRGRVIAGIETTPTNLTSTYFGNLGGVSSAMSARGGLESQTLGLAHLPTGITSSVVASGNAGNFQVDGSAANFLYLSQASGGLEFAGGSKALRNGTQATAAVDVTGTATSNNTSGSPHRTVQPTLIAACDVRVIP